MTAIPAPTTPALPGTHYDTREPRTPAQLLDGMAPAAKQTQLGEVCVDLITQLNNVVADYAALLAKWELFLTHVDGGTLGTSNHATYSPAAQTSVAIQQLGAR